MEENNINEGVQEPQEQEEKIEINTPEKNESKSTGTIVGAIIIVVIIALGGFYFWGQKLNNNSEKAVITPSEENTEATETEQIATTTENPAEVEADLNVE